MGKEYNYFDFKNDEEKYIKSKMQKKLIIATAALPFTFFAAYSAVSYGIELFEKDKNNELQNQFYKTKIEMQENITEKLGVHSFAANTLSVKINTETSENFIDISGVLVKTENSKPIYADCSYSINYSDAVQILKLISTNKNDNLNFNGFAEIENSHHLDNNEIFDVFNKMISITRRQIPSVTEIGLVDEIENVNLNSNVKVLSISKPVLKENCKEVYFNTAVFDENTDNVYYNVYKITASLEKSDAEIYADYINEKSKLVLISSYMCKQSNFAHKLDNEMSL